MKKPKDKTPTRPRTDRDWDIWKQGRESGMAIGKMEGRREFAQELRDLLDVPKKSDIPRN